MSKSLIGSTFGRWTVKKEGDAGRCVCVCECGVERSVLRRSLIRGGSKSCGCLQRDVAKTRKHDYHDITGQKFGRLTAVRLLDERSKFNRLLWLCLCDCGKESVVSSNALTVGNTNSCGCLKNELIGSRRRTHGKSRSPEYVSWCAMKSRCNSPQNQDYALYGGRGIRVCKRWDKSFENFLADMGPQPPGKNTIERVNTDGHYTPTNCCWASQKQQTRNKRNNHQITVNGRTQTIGEWAEETGIPYRRIEHRLSRGWTPERAISTKKFHRFGKEY